MIANRSTIALLYGRITPDSYILGFSDFIRSILEIMRNIGLRISCYSIDQTKKLCHAHLIVIWSQCVCMPSCNEAGITNTRTAPCEQITAFPDFSKMKKTSISTLEFALT